MSTPRGLKLLKSLKAYTQRVDRWDTTHILNKVKLISAGDGKINGEFNVIDSMCNCGDTLHGGFISSMIDVISLFSYISHEKGTIAWTTNMNIYFIGKASLGDVISFETKPVLITRKQAIIDTILTNSNTNLVIVKSLVSLTAADEQMRQFTSNVLNFDMTANS